MKPRSVVRKVAHGLVASAGAGGSSGGGDAGGGGVPLNALKFNDKVLAFNDKILTFN